VKLFVVLLNYLKNFSEDQA